MIFGSSIGGEGKPPNHDFACYRKLASRQRMGQLCRVRDMSGCKVPSAILLLLPACTRSQFLVFLVYLMADSPYPDVYVGVIPPTIGRPMCQKGRQEIQDLAISSFEEHHCVRRQHYFFNALQDSLFVLLFKLPWVSLPRQKGSIFLK